MIVRVGPHREPKRAHVRSRFYKTPPKFHERHPERGKKAKFWAVRRSAEGGSEGGGPGGRGSWTPQTTRNTRICVRRAAVWVGAGTIREASFAKLSLGPNWFGPHFVWPKLAKGHHTHTHPHIHTASPHTHSPNTFREANNIEK